MKKLSILIVLTLMISLLAACGGNNSNGAGSNTGSSNTGSNSNAGSSEKVKIDFWHSLGGTNGEAVAAMVKRFNDSHPNIEVVETFQGSYPETVTKLQQAAASNQAPEVAMVERGFVELFSDAEVLANLGPVIEGAGLSNEDFVQGLMGDTVHEDTLISLPFNRSTPIMHVNKTILDELGMDIPTNWDELQAVAKAAVVKNGSETTRYGLTMPYDTWYPIAMVQQLGGTVFDESKTTTPFVAEGKGKQVFDFLKGLQNEGALFYPPAADSGSIVNSMFTEGKVAVLFQSTGTIGGLLKGVDFDYVTAYLPQNVQYSNPTGGGNIVMFEDAKNKEAGAEFMQWLLTDAGGAQQFVIDTGYLPFTHKMVESDAIKELWTKEPIRETAYKQLEYAVDTNKDLAWPSIQPEFFSAIEAIMYDNEDIDATLAKFQQSAERLLAE